MNLIFCLRNIPRAFHPWFQRVVMAAAGATMGFGKKAALAAAGLFSGVGGAVAYKLDQVIPTDNREEKLKVYV